MAFEPGAVKLFRQKRSPRGASPKIANGKRRHDTGTIGRLRFDIPAAPSIPLPPINAKSQDAEPSKVPIPYKLKLGFREIQC